MKNKIRAIFISLLLIGLLWQYIAEFPTFDNTIGIGNLIGRSIGLAAILSVFCVFLLKKRLKPIENHLPEVFAILLIPLIFAPFFGSFLNRIGASEPTEQSFVFQKEVPFVMSRFGFLRSLQRETASGYHLFVENKDKKYRFRYTRQTYFPITKSGDMVLLPIKIGLFGYPIVDLK
jgi:hypothetical protein